MSFISPKIPDIKMLRVRQAGLLGVELDARIEQKIPVRSRLHISAAPGFTLLGEPKIIPDSVYISGARSTVAKIEYIPTEELSITNLKWNNSLPVKLDLTSLNSSMDIADTSLFVQVQIEPLSRKIFYGIPVHLTGNPDKNTYSLEPSAVDVEIAGGKELLSKINPQDIKLYIAFSRFFVEDPDEVEPIVDIPYSVNSWQILSEKIRLVKAEREFDDEE
jgi:YbbR domain-containing protein